MFFQIPLTGDQKICEMKAPWCFKENKAKPPPEYKSHIFCVMDQIRKRRPKEILMSTLCCFMQHNCNIYFLLHFHENKSNYSIDKTKELNKTQSISKCCNYTEVHLSHLQNYKVY